MLRFALTIELDDMSFNYIAQRLCDILVGDEVFVCSDTKYQLGPSNDYWCHWEKQRAKDGSLEDVISLNFRYTPEQEKLDALTTVIEWRLSFMNRIQQTEVFRGVRPEA